jgi:NADPH-dependent glutamate synthase beta subunit-like oxidoreductase
VAIPGTEPWFDESLGVLTNTHGLVDAATDELGGLYVSGWLKRGPTGIIGTNIADAKDTVASIVHDIQSPASPKPQSSSSLQDLLQERGVKVVDWEAYQRIDATETSDERRRHPEQPREKITALQELLNVAFS